jgi:hypothetical protein
LAQKTGALAKFGISWGIFVDFWSGFGPFYKYFSEAKGPAAILPSAQRLWHSLQQAQGLLCKFHENIVFLELFFQW